MTNTMAGALTCTLATSAATGGMRLAPGIAPTTGIHPAADTSVLFFLITANNGAGTEGSLGYDSVPTARTADDYCAR